MELCENYKNWLNESWEKLLVKMSAEVDRIGDRIPFVAVDGKYPKYYDETLGDLYWWTNGFWPGMLWQMYNATGDERYKTAAEGVEKRMDACLADGVGLHHDTGFMWLHTSVANYRKTGSEEAKNRGIHAANMLAGRYNPDGKFIRAWNGWDPVYDNSGWIIVDCMMNIHLLFWASEVTGDPRYKQVAIHHADTTLDKIVRADGSCAHIAALDTATGELDFYPRCQGYGPGSSWSRGQAWAIYGYAATYKHTGDKKYLDAAKNIAHYFLANVAQTGGVPLCDFRSPAEPVMYDSSAGVCAACGMLEIAQHVPEFEKALYEKGAVSMLRACVDKFCDWDPERDAMLGGGTGSYFHDRVHVPYIWADYFMVEAFARLMDKDIYLW